MTLFATLTKAAGSSSSSSNNNSCSPPEAIQLHGNKFINFVSAKTVNLDDDDDHNDENVTDLKHFSALSYQAVQTQREDVGTKKRHHLRPDLGIWDCRIQSSTATAAATDNTAMLLQRVIINKKGGKLNNKKEQGNEDEDEKKEAADEIISNDDDCMELPPTVVLTVDTTNPNSVQPSLEQMRNVLLGMMNEETSSSSSNNNSNNHLLLSRESIQISTSMKVLQSSPFGVTKITESVGSSLQDSSSKRVAIIIAAIVASSSSNNDDNDDGKTAADEFKERQAKSLVLYHLHKFALECDCTLCFVRGDDDDTDGDDGLLAKGIQNLNIGDDTVEQNENGDKDSNDTNEAQKKKAKSASLSIDEFGKVIRRVAMGLSPVEEQQDVTNEEEAKTGDAVVASSEISAIHAPGSHDAELIHGAYLRNASCEGYWDASKDDLIVALSPPPQLNTNDTLQQQQKEEPKKGTATTASSSGGGDEEWLSKLAASVGLTPEAITTSGGDAAVATTVSSSSTTPSGKKSPKRERPGVKKRVSRVASSKTKDGKPKDQKAVLNFFDDLLKK